MVRDKSMAPLTGLPSPLHSRGVPVISPSLPKPPLWLQVLSWPMTMLTDEIFGDIAYQLNRTGVCMDKGVCRLFNHKAHADATNVATLILLIGVIVLLVVAVVTYRRDSRHTMVALTTAAVLLMAPFATTSVWSFPPPVERSLLPRDKQVYVRSVTLIPPSRPARDSYYNASQIRHFNAVWTKNTGSDNPSWLAVERMRRGAPAHCEAYFRQWDTMLPPRRAADSSHRQSAARQLAHQPGAAQFTAHNPDVIPRTCTNDGLVAATSADMFESLHEPYRCAARASPRAGRPRPTGALDLALVSPSTCRARPVLHLAPRPGLGLGLALVSP